MEALVAPVRLVGPLSTWSGYWAGAELPLGVEPV